MAAELESLSDIKDVSETFKNFVDGLRAYLRDYEVLNRLTDGKETSNRMLVHSVLMMVSNFSSTPPPLGWFSLESLVDTHYMYESCIAGASYYTIMSVLNLYKRNELPFDDGGLRVDTPAMIAWMEKQAFVFKEEWETAKIAKKIQLNIEGCHGIESASSEYATLQGWVGRMR